MDNVNPPKDTELKIFGYFINGLPPFVIYL